MVAIKQDEIKVVVGAGVLIIIQVGFKRKKMNLTY